MVNYKKFKEILINSFKSVYSHRLRSLITILGIALGAGATVVLYGLNLNFTSHTLTNMEKLGGKIITLTFPQNVQRDVIKSQLDQLNAFLEVSAYFLEKEHFIENKGKKIMVFIRGIDNSFLNLRKADFSEKILPASRKCFINGKLFKESNGFLRPGEKIKIGHIFFEIEKILGQNTSDFFELYPIIYLKISDVQNLTLPFYQGYFLKLKKTDNVSLVEKILKKVFSKNLGIKIFSPANAKEVINQFKRLASLLIFLVTFLTIFVGGLGVANVMLINITEKTYEYGILMTLGLTQVEIFYEVITESILLSFLGSFLGVFVGILLDLILALILGINFIFPVLAVVVVIFASFLFGFLFGFYPAFRAKSLEPVEAVRGG